MTNDQFSFCPTRQATAAMCDLARVAAVDVHLPDFPPAGAVRLIGDVPAMGRPGRAFVAALRGQLQELSRSDVGDENLKAASAAVSESEVAAIGRPRRRIGMAAARNQRALISPAGVH